ncbi:MAG: DNA polymerase III subunit delta' [Moraxellaceae bacterium]|nr:DNA polymerase III subunit delta' [Moraxellaceae bacterium]
MNTSLYFAPIFPWQTQLWQRLTHAENLPHALLASGMQGIGKRQFIWRWVAWQLCQNKSMQTACGHCESCQWLIAGTHPDLRILPPIISEDDTKKAKKISQPTIKIDDVREIQNFVHQGSQGLRICVFDHAETMTIASANALLKTLEEPKQNVQLILITDKPTLLLPTIKSRVQQLPLNQIEQSLACQYVEQQLGQTTHIPQLLALSGYAPLQAVKMAQADWYSMRATWLKIWLALRTYQRMPTLASDYWQSQLELADFVRLTQIMLSDLQRLSCNLPTHQQDVDFSEINPQNMPKISDIQKIGQILQEINHSLKQNVQDKLAYDMLMQSLVSL